MIYIKHDKSVVFVKEMKDWVASSTSNKTDKNGALFDLLFIRNKEKHDIWKFKMLNHLNISTNNFCHDSEGGRTNQYQ